MLRFLPILHGLLAVALYGVNANFTILLFTSGFAGWEYCVRFAFALGFEGFKVTAWIEGVVRKSLLLKVLAIAFSLGSLMTATLGMVMGELLDTQRKEVINYAESAEDEGVRKSIKVLESQLETEQKRLSEGSAMYRTDAKETRASIERITKELGELYARLGVLAKQQATQVRGATEETNPLAQVSELLGPQARPARLAFGGYQALMLELGGMASAILALRKKRERPTPEEPRAASEDGRSAKQVGFQGLMDIAFEPKAKNGSFPSYARVKEVVSREDYDATVKRGLLAGVLRKSHGKCYITKGVSKEEFYKEVLSWPE